jgi:hypothetical protein
VWRQITGIAETRRTMTGLSSATGYDFQVRAINSGGASGFAARANGITRPVTITLNYSSRPPSAHGRSPGVDATVVPAPAIVREAWGSSATVEPAAGWTDGDELQRLVVGLLPGGRASASAGTAKL